MFRVPGKISKVHETPLGRLYRILFQINVDSTHPVLNRRLLADETFSKHDINLFPPWLRERPNRSVEPDTSLYYHALLTPPTQQGFQERITVPSLWAGKKVCTEMNLQEIDSNYQLRAYETRTLPD